MIIVQEPGVGVWRSVAFGLGIGNGNGLGAVACIQRLFCVPLY